MMPYPTTPLIKIKGPFYLTNVMHLVPKNLKETFQNNLVQKFIYIVNKSANMVMQPTNISPFYATLENGGVVMMSKICINQLDVKLSMSNYTTLTNATHWYMPNC